MRMVETIGKRPPEACRAGKPLEGRDAEAVATVLLGEAMKRVLPGLDRRLPPGLRALCDAEDVLQDALLVLLEKGALRGPSCRPRNLVALLRKVARDRLSDLARHHLHTRKAGRDHEQPLHDRITAHDPPPADEAEADDLAGWLASEAGGRASAVDLLRAGFAQREVGAALGISQKAVQRLVLHLRQKLGGRLGWAARIA